MSAFRICTEPKTFQCSVEALKNITTDLKHVFDFVKHQHIKVISAEQNHAELDWLGMGKIKVNRQLNCEFPEVEYTFSGLMGYTLILRISIQVSDNLLCIETETQIPVVFRAMVKPQLLQFQNQFRDALCALTS
jgi:hypothetical protein